MGIAPVRKGCLIGSWARSRKVQKTFKALWDITVLSSNIAMPTLTRDSYIADISRFRPILFTNGFGSEIEFTQVSQVSSFRAGKALRFMFSAGSVPLIEYSCCLLPA